MLYLGMTVCEPPDHFCGNFPTAGAHQTTNTTVALLSNLAHIGQGRISCLKKDFFLQSVQMLMSLFDNGLWSLWGGIHSLALLDQLWSTVSWTLVVLDMLVMMMMVLVGFGGNHSSISQKRSLWKEKARMSLI